MSVHGTADVHSMPAMTCCSPAASPTQPTTRFSRDAPAAGVEVMVTVVHPVAESANVSTSWLVEVALAASAHSAVTPPNRGDSPARTRRVIVYSTPGMMVPASVISSTPAAPSVRAVTSRQLRHGAGAKFCPHSRLELPEVPHRPIDRENVAESPTIGG